MENPNRPNVERGDSVSDRITLFTGIVTAVQFFRSGVAKAQVQPRELKDGKPIEPQIFDFEDLTIVAKGVVPAIPLADNGGFELGDLAECTTSGFRGVIESKRISLSGCTQWSVHSNKLNKKGRLVGGYLFLPSQIRKVKAQAFERVPVPAGTGPAPLGRSAR